MSREESKKWINVKRDSPETDLLLLHPKAFSMLAYVSNFCLQNGIKLVLSSIGRTEERNREVGARSKTHVYHKVNGIRAFDVSIKAAHGWNENLINELVNEISEEFEKIGALVKRNGSLYSRPVFRHGQGDADHLHFQCRPGR